MPPSSAQVGRPRAWSPIERNLRTLRRSGLRNPPLHNLGELVAVARSLSAAKADHDRLIDALARAIDACWGGAASDLPTLRDTMRLWFGLPAVDDAHAPDTAKLRSAQRQTTAWEYWVGPELSAGKQPKEALATFRTNKARDRYIALAQKLVELEATPARAKPTPVAPSDTTRAPLLSVSTVPQQTVSSRFRFLHHALGAVRMPRQQVAIFLVILAAGTVVAWAPWRSGGKPPFGAIVNAETGAWSMTAPETPVENPIGLSGGRDLAVCDLTVDPRCHYNERTTYYEPLHVHVGDRLRFSLQLSDGYGTPIPYMSLRASMNTDSLSRQTHLRIPKLVAETLRRAGIWEVLSVNVSVQWPTSGTLGSGIVAVRSAEIYPVYLQPPISGVRYMLRYQRGSSYLAARPHFFRYLPDGIMGRGIALQDVGAPTNCDRCDGKYIRFVDFEAEIAREPTSPGQRSKEEANSE